jgi:hypothetical protein
MKAEQEMDEAEFDAIIIRKDIVKIRQLAEMPDLPLDLQRKLFAYSDAEVRNSIVKKIQDKCQSLEIQVQPQK